MYEFLKRQMFFSFTLLYIFESLIEIALGSILNLLYPTYDSYGEYLCVILSGILLTIVLTLPFLLGAYLRRNIEHIKEANFLKRFGEVVIELN